MPAEYPHPLTPEQKVSRATLLQWMLTHSRKQSRHRSPMMTNNNCKGGNVQAWIQASVMNMFQSFGLVNKRDRPKI